MLSLRVIRALSQASANPLKRAPRLPTLAIHQKRSLMTQYAPCRPRIPPSCLGHLASASAPIDHLPTRVSLHPSAASVQVRNAPRNTFNPSHRVRKRRHGFLSRLRTRTGRNTLKRRRLKRRSTLSH